MTIESWLFARSRGVALALCACAMSMGCSNVSQVAGQPAQAASHDSDSKAVSEARSLLFPRWSSVVPPSAQRVVLSSDREWIAYALPLPRQKRGEPSRLRVVVRKINFGPSPDDLSLGDELEIEGAVDSRWPAPRWSHQGHRLAYISGTFDDYAVPVGKVYADIHVVEIPKTGEHVSKIVVATVSSPSSPAWTPDDRSVGLAIDVYPRSKFIISDLKTETTTEIPTDVPSSLDQVVSWSPNGEVALIVTDSKVMVCELDNRSVKLIVRLSAGASLGWTDPQWAPDRSHAVFVADDKIFSYEQGDREARQWKRGTKVVAACYIDDGRSVFIVEKLRDSPSVLVRLDGRCDIERWIYRGTICSVDDLSAEGREVFRHSATDSARMVVEGGAVARELPEVFDCLLNAARH